MANEINEVLDLDLDEEQAEVESEPIQEEPAAFDDEVVRLGDREFTLEEPSLEVTLRILNVIGRLGLRGERIAAQQIAQGPTARAAIWGLLAALAPQDLARFGSAVLQFEDDKNGQKWLKELHKEGKLKVAPLVKAFFINWTKSEDLQEALVNFQVGLAMLGVMLGNVGLGAGSD